MEFTAHQFGRAVQSLGSFNRSAASTDGTVVDCLGYEECLVVADFGLATGAGTADVTVRQSVNADGSASTAVTGATFAQVVAANDNTAFVGRIKLSGVQRYLFARVVGDGANGVQCSVDFVLMNPKYPPATQVNANAFSV